MQKLRASVRLSDFTCVFNYIFLTDSKGQMWVRGCQGLQDGDQGKILVWGFRNLSYHFVV